MRWCGRWTFAPTHCRQQPPRAPHVGVGVMLRQCHDKTGHGLRGSGTLHSITQSTCMSMCNIPCILMHVQRAKTKGKAMGDLYAVSNPKANPLSDCGFSIMIDGEAQMAVVTMAAYTMLQHLQVARAKSFTKCCELLNTHLIEEQTGRAY